MRLDSTYKEIKGLNNERAGLANATGLQITSLEFANFAIHAGLKYHDIILSINGEAITELGKLLSILDKKPESGEFVFKVYRENSEEIIDIKIKWFIEPPAPHWVDNMGAFIIGLSAISMLILFFVWLAVQSNNNSKIDFPFTMFVNMIIACISTMIFGAVLRVLASIELNLRMLNRREE